VPSVTSCPTFTTTAVTRPDRGLGTDPGPLGAAALAAGEGAGEGAGFACAGTVPLDGVGGGGEEIGAGADAAAGDDSSGSSTVAS